MRPSEWLPREADALACWLGDARRPGFADLHGGIGWHVRDGRAQDVVGMPDVLMLLPIPPPSVGGDAGFHLLVGLELKIGDDPVTAEQADALARIRRLPGWGGVAFVVRYGTPRPGEWTQDEAVEAIRAALGIADSATVSA